MFNFLKNVNQLNSDIISILVILAFLVVSIITLSILKKKEASLNMKNEKKQKNDKLDLEAITKNIEADYKPINIKLTSYEEEQEQSAIISYDELINKSNFEIQYDDKFINTTEIPVKKVGIAENIIGATKIETPKLEVSLMSYEKEEAFLKALRKLQSDLAR